MIRNLIFSGGSIHVLSYIGCLKVLEEHNLLQNVNTYSGTSSGGIFCLLLNLGYNHKELEKLCLKLNFSKFKDISSKTILSFMNNYGIDSGNKLLNFVKILIKKRMGHFNITFLDLFKKTKKKLVLTGTCINKQCLEYFSYETRPNMKIIDAIRITFSIPLIYAAVKLCSKCWNVTCKCNVKKNIFVDGAILENYPISIFKNCKKECLGFMLTSNINNVEIIDMSIFMFDLLLGIKRRLSDYQFNGYEDITVKIPVNGNGLDFSLNKKRKNKLMGLGYKYTMEHIKKNKLGKQDHKKN